MKLFAHQQQIVDEFPKRSVLVWSTGTGKSLAAIELAKKAYQPTLFIVPKSLKTKWTEDMPSEFPYKIMTKEEFKKEWDKLTVFPCVIVDEAHYFFGTKSQMMKSLKGYFKKWNTPYRYLLTATPYRSTPMDIFIMADLLGKPLNYPIFFRKFFYEIQMGFRRIPRVRAGIEPEIAKIVKRLGSVVSLDECVDMPDQVYETEYFSLTKEQQTAMDRVMDILPIVRYTKYHQIAGGTLKGNEYENSQVFPSDKRDRLVELAEQNDKMIVVCRYNNEIEILGEILANEGQTDHTIAYINGSVEGTKRHGILKILQKTRKYILLVNAACSEGWELPDCPLMIFYSLDFSLKNYIQMQGRIQRINNIKRNTYIHFVVKGTIDEEVYKSMMRKEDFHLALYNE